MQDMYTIVDGELGVHTLPAPDVELLPGVCWGAFDEIMTPAWWAGQCWQQRLLNRYADLRLGRDLVEEVAACLLGGYGMPAELGLGAYEAVRNAGLLSLERWVCETEIEAVLSRPVRVGHTFRSYRFPKQKAGYLAGCLRRLRNFVEPESDRALRDALATLPGVGLKTASWVVRNYRGSHAVAVLDVHILRAGRHMGLFPAQWTPQRHYRPLEAQFLAFAAAIATDAGLLDAVMWDFMRRIPNVASTKRIAAAH
jgi:thermostable 8-oxoguanine DNA glycosylase